MESIKIKNEYIELGQLLKLKNYISSGGEAKYYLKEHDVFVNEEKEDRRGRKLYPGYIIKIEDKLYKIEWLKVFH